MKRILAAALAFAGLSGGAALAQSYGGSDTGSSPGVPSTSQSGTSNGTDVGQGWSGTQSDSDSVPGTGTNSPGMGTPNDLNVPGSGQSGSELPDLGTPNRNLGEPGTSSPTSTASPDSLGPTQDQGGATLPSSPTNVPDVNR